MQTEEGQVHADGHVQAVAEVDHGPAPVAMQSPRLPGPPPSSPSQPQAVPDQLPESAEDDAKRAAAVLTGNTPPAKRVRVTEEAKESPVAADCRAWTSVQCLHAFNAFFERSTGGCNPDQGKAAASVAELFFLGEMQSGLTVTSVAQPLDMSLQVLDELLARRAENGEAPLTSGSRSVLGDFIAQIRSGEAAVYAPPDQTAVQPAEAPQGQTEAAETVPAIS